MIIEIIRVFLSLEKGLKLKVDFTNKEEILLIFVRVFIKANEKAISVLNDNDIVEGSELFVEKLCLLHHGKKMISIKRGGKVNSFFFKRDSISNKLVETYADCKEHSRLCRKGFRPY